MRHWLALAILSIDASSICMVHCKDDVTIRGEVSLETRVGDVVCEKSMAEKNWPELFASRCKVKS